MTTCGSKRLPTQLNRYSKSKTNSAIEMQVSQLLATELPVMWYYQLLDLFSFLMLNKWTNF